MERVRSFAEDRDMWIGPAFVNGGGTLLAFAAWATCRGETVWTAASGSP